MGFTDPNFEHKLAKKLERKINRTLEARINRTLDSRLAEFIGPPVSIPVGSIVYLISGDKLF